MTPLEGPVVIGTLIDAIMLGLFIVQSCFYYKISRGDSWSLRVLVSLFLFLFLCQLGCTTTWLWASQHGEANTQVASMPEYATIVFGISSLFGAMILFLERCFFSHRVLKRSNNHLLTFLLYLFCIFSSTAAIGAASIFFTTADSDKTSHLSISWIFPFSIIFGLICDLAIIIANAFYLRLLTPTETADDMGFIARLPLSVAETGALTSLFDVAFVLVYWLTKSNFGWIGLLVAMPGVFANTFLAALNVRGHLSLDIQHQRTFKINDKLIDERAKREAPIIVSITKKVEERSEKNPV